MVKQRYEEAVSERWLIRNRVNFDMGVRSALNALEAKKKRTWDEGDSSR